MASKKTRIFAQIRREIIDGQCPAGSRLESQRELATRFGVAGVTIQTALKQLERDGFIESRSRSGTFVVQKPPHLSHYALVFWNDPAAPTGHQSWSRHQIALTQAAQQLRSEGCQLLIYHGIDYHADCEDRQRLLQRIEAYCLAGIIFAGSPHLTEGSPILRAPGIPRVMFGFESPYPHVHCLAYNEIAWLEKAVDYLVARGRRRLALMAFQLDEARDQRINGLLQRRGITVPSYWRQAANPRDPLAAQRCAELLMRGAARARPHGLLILDDNLVDGALAGLHAAGVRLPDDVTVVAHANFPLTSLPVMPLRLLGYDHLAALRVGINLIDRERRGEPVPHSTSLPVVFEEETRAGQRGVPAASPVFISGEATSEPKDAVLPAAISAPAPQPKEILS